ncbi:hydroxymethylglutaryl-CoA reductase, degradative [Candidatus Micrarchaeota archaeon]|nr:hydroxymethylglutaryl-CoA reductase, degradative [Candidatus Micrarchaeota archaeon]
MTLTTEFKTKPPAGRLDELAAECQLTADEKALFAKFGSLDEGTANRMIENVATTYALPMGIATNFKINGKDQLIPMVLEEPSVVAGASFAAKLAQSGGGFTATSTLPIMIGQIQIVHVPDLKKAIAAIERQKAELMAKANAKDPMLVSRGGGVTDIQSRILQTARGEMLIVHLHVNTQDAMGANAVNTMCEAISSDLETITGGQTRLRILTNLAIHRTATATAIWTKESLAQSTKNQFTGEQVVEAMLDAFEFAKNDPYRACTNNKGIMNGIDSVVIATGNDWRAMEAGAHGYAVKNGRYTSLTTYSKTKDGDLKGEITLPVAVGLVGGATRTHPLAKIALKILGVQSARELGEILAAVGLAQNFAAMRALSTEGISRGHMKLHAKNIAVLAGATGDQIDRIAAQMADEKNVNAARAKELLEK